MAFSPCEQKNDPVLAFANDGGSCHAPFHFFRGHEMIGLSNRKLMNKINKPHPPKIQIIIILLLSILEHHFH